MQLEIDQHIYQKKKKKLINISVNF